MGIVVGRKQNPSCVCSLMSEVIDRAVVILRHISAPRDGRIWGMVDIGSTVRRCPTGVNICKNDQVPCFDHHKKFHKNPASFIKIQHYLLKL